MDQKEVICKTCANSVFDEIWGEYKCKKKCRVVDPRQEVDCTDYKKSTKEN
jgi:hypothetical protein